MKQNTIAEIQISYSPHITKHKRTKIKNSKDAYAVLINSWDNNTIELQEEFKILLLNNANEVLGTQNLSKGGTTGTYVDVKLLFAIALKACANGVILAHNHPSGNLEHLSPLDSYQDNFMIKFKKNGVNFPDR